VPSWPCAARLRPCSKFEQVLGEAARTLLSAHLPECGALRVRILIVFLLLCPHHFHRSSHPDAVCSPHCSLARRLAVQSQVEQLPMRERPRTVSGDLRALYAEHAEKNLSDNEEGTTATIRGLEGVMSGVVSTRPSWRSTWTRSAPSRGWRCCSNRTSSPKTRRSKRRSKTAWCARRGGCTSRRVALARV